MARNQQQDNDRPYCFKCRHLVITWQRNMPYECRAMGFRSKHIPWRVVLNSSGMPCQAFQPKGST